MVHKDFIGHDYIDNSYEIYEQNEIKHHFMKLELQFNSSTWQNRPARIYLKGEGISSNSELFKDLNIFSKHLIYFPSSGTDAMSVNFNKRNVNIYKYKGMESVRIVFFDYILISLLHLKYYFNLSHYTIFFDY